MSTKPQITVKNLKYAAFASEETHCYEATIYVDGKRFCQARNEGHGGPDDFWAPSGSQVALIDEIKRVGKRLAPNAVETYDEAHALNEDKEWDDPTWVETFYGAFEHAVGEAVTQALIERDVKKALGNKKRIYFKGPKDKAGEVRYLSARRAVDEGLRAKMLAQINRTYPGAVVLTGMPISEAVKHWC